MQNNSKPKSWELRKKDASKYRFYDKQDEILVKKPGEVDGEAFVLRNCVRCKIFIADFSAQILIDDCFDCQMFFAAVESSMFIRGCKRCKVITACGQFRSKKCEDIQTLLFTQSQPIIELSVRMGFGCFRGYYPQLRQHIQKAKLNIWNNTWSDLHDFDPEKQAEITHFYMVLEDTRYEDMLKPLNEVLSIPNFTWAEECKTENQVIPFTSEQRKKPFHEEVLLIFYPEESSRLNVDVLSSSFQPLLKEVPQMIFAEEDNQVSDQVEIEAPEQLYCYLVKSKYQPLFADNWPLFKTAVETHLSADIAAKLLDQVVVNSRLQPIFSLHIRTDNQDIKLLSYLYSLLEMKLKCDINKVCVVFQNSKAIEEATVLLFANQKDERAGQQ
ncbi:unnamed protein product [Paramecium octaurelia]|uniref:C-CAP/cofactor C-like domain-containing protein n=1 Tax=Paramecium octaurelia TaxID=43137 RepID=A0A8S1WLG6_PAROT|nr:unnamed protein product [Paramecium octaurelia]